MTGRETNRFIDETAADWIARLDRGPLSQDETHALEMWLTGDVRRRGALLRASALSMLSESAQALGPQFDPARFASPRARRFPVMSRRQMLGWAGAGAAVVTSSAVLGINAAAAGAITTGLGEVRMVTLDDGSTVMLNTQTSVKVRYSESVRHVELLYGEAYFTIVRDLRRPFVVDGAGASLHAARAAFRVRKLGGRPVDVLVDQGGVSVGAARGQIMMQAHTRIALPLFALGGAAPTPQPISTELVSRELAWREGKIAFEGEPLGQAAAEFARYSKTRIEIRDPALGREPVTGLFSASDPVGFSRAIGEVFGAHLEQRRNAVILSRPAQGL
jgi:transmembrane sensor